MLIRELNPEECDPSISLCSMSGYIATQIFNKEQNDERRRRNESLIVATKPG